MNRAEHIAAAEDLLERVKDTDGTPPADYDPWVTACLAAAQVRATLALAAMDIVITPAAELVTVDEAVEAIRDGLQGGVR